MYNFNPEYSVDELNSRQNLNSETIAQPLPFQVRLQSFSGFHLKYCFGFLEKYMCENSCGTRNVVSSAILEYVSLANGIWCRHKKTITGGVM